MGQTGESGRLRVMRVIARMNVGGPAMQVVALMRGLDPDLFDQRLYSGQVGPDEADYRDARASDVVIHRVPHLGRAIRADDDLRALARLTAEMRRFRPHIVHTHTAKAGALGRVAAAIAGVPVRVHTFHGHLLSGYFSPAKTRAVIATERVLAGLSDHLVAVGTQVRDDLVAARVGRFTQYTVVPPGTALSAAPVQVEARRRLGLPLDRPVVAFVGRITGIKRPDRLVEVARRVRETVGDVTFAVCGHGDQFEELSQTAGELDGTLRMLGWRHDIETVYAAADLALLTSDNEGMPVSLIEAALAGVPAVATDVGSVAEVVEHGVSGLLGRTDAAELSQHVVRLLTDEPLRRQMAMAARDLAAKRFGVERLVGDINDLYTSIAVARRWWPQPADREDVLR